MNGDLIRQMRSRCWFVFAMAVSLLVQTFVFAQPSFDTPTWEETYYKYKLNTELRYSQPDPIDWLIKNCAHEWKTTECDEFKKTDYCNKCGLTIRTLIKSKFQDSDFGKPRKI